MKMVSFLTILTFFLVFVTILRSSNTLKCHYCYGTPECAKKYGGPLVDCSKTDTIDPTKCVTVKTFDGRFSRFCINSSGIENCNHHDKSEEYKCKLCDSNGCNIHTKV